MKLGTAQRKFSLMLAQLIIFAYSKGYEISIGDVYALPADKRHRPGSFHYKKLAADLNLFKDGIYFRKTEKHRILGEFWEVIGGTWGGRFKRVSDGNHYSYLEGKGIL